MKKIVFLAVLSLFAFTGCGLKFKNQVTVLTPDQARAKAEEFINNNLVQKGSKATIKEVKEEKGLYKVAVTLGSQEIVSYITKDGTKFFPQVMDVAETEKQAAGKKNQDDAAAEKQAADVPKKARPEVELFVMSHCPYGTQIEKGMIPAVEALGGKVDFKLKFVDYAMHGEKELDEQLRQECIKKDGEAVFFKYLKCFLEDGNADRCLKAANINAGKISACATETDKKFKVKEKFQENEKLKASGTGSQFPPFDIYKADNDKYGVQGSPTLVVNGEQVQTARDAASLLSAICAGFEKKPAECDKKLSNAAPSPGFGTGTGSAANANAGCGQ